MPGVPPVEVPRLDVPVKGSAGSSSLQPEESAMARAMAGATAIFRCWVSVMSLLKRAVT
jgi:hypothetical protein